jgi:hypothetical protein
LQYNSRHPGTDWIEGGVARFRLLHGHDREQSIFGNVDNKLLAR